MVNTKTDEENAPQKLFFSWVFDILLNIPQIPSSCLMHRPPPFIFSKTSTQTGWLIEPRADKRLGTVRSLSSGPKQWMHQAEMHAGPGPVTQPAVEGFRDIHLQSIWKTTQLVREYVEHISMNHLQIQMLLWVISLKPESARMIVFTAVNQRTESLQLRC